MDRFLRARLESGARITLKEARDIARKFSRRIPLATTLKSDRINGVYIEVDATLAPNAVPFEKALRHPLFGDREHWYRQPYRPFLEIALARTADQVTEEVANYMDDLTRKAGYR